MELAALKHALAQKLLALGLFATIAAATQYIHTLSSDEVSDYFHKLSNSSVTKAIYVAAVTVRSSHRHKA